MGVTWIPCEIPDEIVSDADSFAKHVRENGYMSGCIWGREGEATTISLFNHDGEQQFAKKIDSEWFVLYEIPGGNDE